MLKFKEKKLRSFVKATSYRIVIITADSLLIFLLTHRLQLALEVVVVSNLYSTGLYFAHERIWDQISWGKIKTGK